MIEIKFNGKVVTNLVDDYFKKETFILPIEKLNKYETLDIEVLN